MNKPTFEAEVQPTKKVSRLTFKDSKIKCSRCDGREIHNSCGPRCLDPQPFNSNPCALFGLLKLSAVEVATSSRRGARRARVAPVRV
jgi:hypothetical protein